jgi:cysteine desulfurase
MKNVYLDNASTTKPLSSVIEIMKNSLEQNYGNASSIHSFGRNAKSAVENARKSIAKKLNCSSSEIIFTSGATEANNWILTSAVNDLQVERIITSKTEHQAVLQVVENLEKKHKVIVEYLPIDEFGQIKLADLVTLLNQKIKTIVSLMHVNNETGVMFDIDSISKNCKQSHAYFHSDTVQSMGKYNFDLQTIAIDFLVASAHKFHGPKGIGFVFKRKSIFLKSIITGGEQEKGLRAGTEAVHNIQGLEAAFLDCYQNIEDTRIYISKLKDYTISALKIVYPDMQINGGLNTSHSILNVLLPIAEQKAPLLLFALDMQGIAVSKGSACQSGSYKNSHVLIEMLSETDLKKPGLRISFSKFNTKDDIDHLVSVLKTI